MYLGEKGFVQKGIESLIIHTNKLLLIDPSYQRATTQCHPSNFEKIDVTNKEHC